MKCPNCDHQLKQVKGEVKMAIQLTDQKGRCAQCGLADCNNDPCKIFGSDELTIVEIKMLKEIVDERIRLDSMTKYGKEGKPIERGNYSDWVKAMKRGGKK